MNFKKRVNGSWTDTPHYIHNTATDTLTTLPADIYANDTTATVGLKGNMEQSGTPTPTDPVQPQECGDMSSNLWSYHPDTTSGGVGLLWDGEKIKYSNTCIYASNSIKTINLKKGTYTLKVNANRIPVENDYSCIDIYHSSSGLLKQVTNRNAVNGKVTFTLDDDLSNVSLRIRLDNGTNYDGFEIRPMLNIGETSLPYDVYGQYKIPILNNSQTTNVYLGEVQSTRRIKKLVLDGTEDWQTYGSVSNTYRLSISNTQSIGNPAICSHFVNSPISSITSGKFTVGSTWIYIRYADVADLANFKSYLAQQYAAGTPVTIWYVLAEPQTAVVNEPLRKIGDYADMVSGITIPTIAGANTLSVDTTLQPSEVTATYKGWHPVADVHERESGAWD